MLLTINMMEERKPLKKIIMMDLQGIVSIITMTMCGQWTCDSDQWERVAVFQRSWQSATDYSLLIPRGPGRETLRIINDIVLTCHLSLVLTDIHLLY